jgi:hypothetical protein
MAIFAVAGATIATHSIPVIGERAAFLIFFFAIIQSSFWLGLKPGLLAMALSLPVVNVLILFPLWISEPYNAFWESFFGRLQQRSTWMPINRFECIRNGRLSGATGTY